MTVYPDYYPKFCCIADKCKHNCCIGWEIDIDEDTLFDYYTADNELYDDFRANINAESDPPCFRLGEGGRCSFLDERNLCRIIKVMGKDALCEICSEHPRFRNFFDTRTEIGLGLCCEEAARLILTSEEPFTLVVSDDGGSCKPNKDEVQFFECRDRMIDICNDSRQPVSVKMRAMSFFSSVALDCTYDELSGAYRSLERLDPLWDKMLDMLIDAEGHEELIPENEVWNHRFRQLLTYFIYRHFHVGRDLNDYSKGTNFAILAVRVIKGLCIAQTIHNGSCSEADFLEFCRMYSAEIEYCDENVQTLLRKLC